MLIRAHYNSVDNAMAMTNALENNEKLNLFIGKYNKLTDNREQFFSNQAKRQ